MHEIGSIPITHRSRGTQKESSSPNPGSTLEGEREGERKEAGTLVHGRRRHRRGEPTREGASVAGEVMDSGSGSKEASVG
jgi:hypothetical protein